MTRRAAQEAASVSGEVAAAVEVETTTPHPPAAVNKSAAPGPKKGPLGKQQVSRIASIIIFCLI